LAVWARAASKAKADWYEMLAVQKHHFL